MALFGEKYGDTVRVVSRRRRLGVASSCAAAATSTAPATSVCVSIVSERGVAAGVRRIEAVTGRGAVERLQQRERSGGAAGRALPGLVRAAARAAGASATTALAELEDEVRRLKHQLASGEAGGGEVRREVDGFTVLARRVPGDGARPSCATSPTPCVRSSAPASSCSAWSRTARRPCWWRSPTTWSTGSTPAAVVRELAPIVGGRGGGRPNLAQAGGPGRGQDRRRARQGPRGRRGLGRGEVGERTPRPPANSKCEIRRTPPEATRRWRAVRAPGKTRNRKGAKEATTLKAAAAVGVSDQRQRQRAVHCPIAP